VVTTLCARGEAIRSGVQSILSDADLHDVFSISGHPSWTFLNMRDARGATAFGIKTLWMQEMHQRGILSVGTHNLSYAHSTADVAALLAAYREVLPFIGQVLNHGRLHDVLRCAPLVPLFKVR
jgi:glutamate-1-semialdehyde 2,1-aminomutase